MKTSIIVYLEDHSVPYLCKKDLPKRLKSGIPTCLLTETSPSSFAIKAIQERLKDLSKNKAKPRSFYTEKAWRTRWFWKEAFNRMLFFAEYLSRRFEKFEVVGADPRVSNLRFKDFKNTDGFFQKALREKGYILENIHKGFLEEQAFMAWYIAKKVAELESRGFKQFVFPVGLLHYASLRKYLSASHRNIVFVRIYMPYDKRTRIINGTDASIHYLMMDSYAERNNSDSWLLHKFFS